MNSDRIFSLRFCAVCGGNNVHLLYKQRFYAFLCGLLENYHVVTCLECGFCFADHLPDQAAFDRYYSEMSKYEYGEQGGRESPHDLAKFQELTTLLLPYLRSPDERILEVGCATGRLLSLIQKAGHPNVLGVDPSPACVRAATALYGVPAITGTLNHMDVAPGNQDFVILSGVLEHVQDVDNALQRLSLVLADEGRLCIAVPDASRYVEGEDAPFQEFSVEHINFFGPVSLTNLLNRHGFTRIGCEQRTMTVNYRTTTPVIIAVFEKMAGNPPAAQWTRDVTTARSLTQYIAKSVDADRKIQAIIGQLADEQKPILVWGTGAHTLRLLETSRLREVPIKAFIDNNASYQGKQLCGVPILPPTAVHKHAEPILISSHAYQQEIANRISKDMNLPNRVILLYSLADAQASSLMPSRLAATFVKHVLEIDEHPCTQK